MKITTSSNDLKIFCDKAIKNSDYIAIDTEFVRNKTYYPILCLLQLAFKEQNTKFQFLSVKLIFALANFKRLFPTVRFRVQKMSL